MAEFPEVVREFLAREAPGLAPRVTGDGGQLVVALGPVTHFVGLKVLERRCGGVEGASLPLWLERSLIALRTAPAHVDLEKVRARLVPRLRTQASVDFLELEAQLLQQMHGETAPDLRVAHRPWVGGLAELLAFEMAEEAVDVAEVHLRHWGLTREDAMAHARATLAGRSGVELQQVSAGLFHAPFGDGNDAARLLVPGVFESVAVRGELLAMAPHQEALFVTGTEEAEGLSQLAGIALELGQQPLALSGELFRFADGGFQRWTPPPEHPAAPVLRSALLPTQVRSYERQKELLDAQAELSGSGEEAAPFLVLRDEAGGLVSATVWMEGQEPLLARADRIAFARSASRDGDEIRAVAMEWDEALALPGVTLEPTAHRPERWKARGFPSPELLRPS